MHKLTLAMQKTAAPSCVTPHPAQWGWGEDRAVRLLYLCLSTPGWLRLRTACSMRAAVSGLQGDWENASLYLQIFTSTSVDFFTFVPTINLCFLILILGWFFFFILLLKEVQAFLFLSDMQHIFRSVTTVKKRGFKIILLQVNSGNHLCKAFLHCS